MDPEILHQDDTPFRGQPYVLGGAWFTLLLAAYGSARMGCLLGIPYDGVTGFDPYNMFNDITKLLQAGFLLQFFVGALDMSRFAWLFSRRQWYFAGVFLLTIPIFGAVSNIPAFRHSLHDRSAWGPAMYVLVVTGAAALCFAIGWHIWMARRHMPRRDFLTYLVSRTTVLMYYIIGGSAIRCMTGIISIHIHHLYLGWALAMWSVFNHPISGMTLAIGMGIFVQGIGAYSYADIFTPPAVRGLDNGMPTLNTVQ